MLQVNLVNPSLNSRKFQLLSTLPLNNGFVSREKLSDHKPISDLFTFKSASNIVLRAALLPTNLVLLEYNKFLMEQEKKLQDGVIDEMEEFDWNAVVIANYNKFTAELCRLSCVALLKKWFEALCIENLSISFADKLTKDATKSAVRKYLRNPTNRYGVCERLIFTSLRGNALMYVSYFVYDVGAQFLESCRQAFVTCQKKGVVAALQQFPLTNVAILALKKAIFLLTSWGATSVGFAVGSYFNINSGGIVGATLLDLLAGQVVQSIVALI